MTRHTYRPNVLVTVEESAPYMPVLPCQFCDGLRPRYRRMCAPCSQKVLKYNETVRREAHRILTKAVRIGKIRRPSEFDCADCGKRAQHYDHRDYSKPLDVEPVCRGCNARRGHAVQYPLTEIFPERVVRLRAAGETWAVIGQVLGVTRQRAQALVKRYETRDKAEA